MSSLFKSTLNTRVLPIDGLRYIRSDVPLLLTDDEIKWLVSNNITTFVDLRSFEEVEKKPCALKDIKEFTYYNLPVAGGGGTPKSREHLYEVYRGMIDKQMDLILETIQGAPSNVMYFCTAGKDRTGVVSALLLKKLGVKEEVIIEDYMMSKDNLMDMLTAYVKEHPEVDIDIIIPRRENIERVLRYVESIKKV